MNEAPPMATSIQARLANPESRNRRQIANDSPCLRIDHSRKMAPNKITEIPTSPEAAAAQAVLSEKKSKAYTEDGSLRVHQAVCTQRQREVKA
jgi:hypothetical protein